MRLVIPAGASPADVAFQGKTWQQIADERSASRSTCSEAMST